MCENLFCVGLVIPSQAYKDGWDRIYRDISRRCQPIPPNKTHKDKRKYDRKKQKKQIRQEVEDV